MSPRVVLIRHGEEPEDDRLITYFRYKGIEPQIMRPCFGESLGEVDDSVIATALYGGQYNVFEEHKHPFLHQENRWIRQCLDKQVPMLGICQGAQSIARVLGAEVGPKSGEPFEFGYYELTPANAACNLFPPSLVVPQAHFHEFQLPQGAQLLAKSALFGQQAFRYGPSTYGFQFHPEVTIPAFRRWQFSKAHVYGRSGVQDKATQDRLMQQHDFAVHRWFMGFLDGLYGEAVAQALAD
ncbi:glutamine amidotransferase [Alteromonas aestuariivivens]|uniref:Glutamine amidotransferase n=1 Tax=Alteromonas aestuariivivens TaxID=1938339 RepID=A0A3D8MF87_9ALTE|nr:glutamine amidotransferase [Alteromonas aestuariivivens]